MNYDREKGLIKLSEDEHGLVPGPRTWPISDVFTLYDLIASVREGYLDYDTGSIPYGAKYHEAIKQRDQALEIATIAMGQLEELMLDSPR